MAPTVPGLPADHELVLQLQVRLRLTPEIRFVLDDSIERTERIYKLLDQVGLAADDPLKLALAMACPACSTSACSTSVSVCVCLPRLCLYVWLCLCLYAGEED